MQISKHRETRGEGKVWEARISWNGEKRGDDRNTEAESSRCSILTCIPDSH